MYTNLFTSVNAIFSMGIVFPDLKIYFIGTQTLPDGPRLPPLPGAVLFYCGVNSIFFSMIIATIIGAIAFLPSIALNIALACGAPLGAYAMNARYKVIPPEVRKAFIVPTTMQFVALFVLLSAGHILPEVIPFLITRILAFFFALYLTFYTATVLFSTAHKERTVMGSFAVVTSICFWITAFGTLSWE